MQELYHYELDAARYSLALFHQAGVRDLDAWLSDYFHCDWNYLLHYYKTGEKRSFRSFWRNGTPLIQPLAIPEFHPTVWKSRWGGTVL
jgi:type 1 glutamine amidotransferase